jgi:hypothetical protein
VAKNTIPGASAVSMGLKSFWTFHVGDKNVVAGTKNIPKAASKEIEHTIG